MVQMLYEAEEPSKHVRWLWTCKWWLQSYALVLTNYFFCPPHTIIIKFLYSLSWCQLFLPPY